MNTDHKYSNFQATLAIAKASFRSIMRSPSAVVFSLAFPLVFIVVFANIGNRPVTVDVGIARNCDTLNPVYQALQHVGMIRLVRNQSDADMQKNLSKGELDAVIRIQKAPAAAFHAPLRVDIEYTNASQKGNILRSALNNILFSLNAIQNPGRPQLAEVHEATIRGRQYKYIDFLLPGMLGFSLLSSGVFGTAFVFLSLRITLVIKRFFATPVKRYSIVIGEAIARLVFSWIGALFIILIGHYCFGFTLIHGLATVVNMLILSGLGLIVFMGFGFIISGIAKNESSVPPIANIVTLPQFLLCGTFFSVSAFPSWLQALSRLLPLTYLNTALRNVAFEGASLPEVAPQLLVLGIWFVLVYAVAVKTFRWE